MSINQETAGTCGRWSSPVQLYRSLVKGIEVRQTTKEKRDFITAMIRYSAWAILRSKWARLAVGALTVAAITWGIWKSNHVDSNAVIAIFTVVMAYTTWLGWRAMRDQNDIMLRQLGQTDETLAHMRSENRPWLAISKPELFYTRDEEAKFEFDLTNHGKSPCAVRVALYGLAFELDSDAAMSRAKSSLAIRSANEGGVVPPGSTTEAVTVFTVKWTEEQLKAMTTGDLYVAIAGKITYGSNEIDFYETAFMFGTKTACADLLIWGGAAENFMR